ncbi:MAG: hypothetical protein R8F63_07000 [Acidimicrobiales bacterium]|nr:hypothetical protein [Acidimicrobiales bacterium]
MLKRIKVRGKLLLLLATPLVAVMVFAYAGIIDRTEATTHQEREARIAEFANAGADLSLSIQVERIRLLEVERLSLVGADLLSEERLNTDAQLERWVESYTRVRGELENPDLVASLDDITSRLPETIGPDRGTDSVTGTLLAGASRSIDDNTMLLAGEAADLELFRALTNLNELLTIQSSYASITSVGADAIFQGEWDAVGLTRVSEAEQDAERAIASFNATADAEYVTQFVALQESGQIPSPVPGRVDVLADIQSYMDDPGVGGVLTWLEQGKEQLTALNGLIDQSVTATVADAQLAATTANEEAQSFLILAGSVALLTLVMAVAVGRSISRPLIRLTRNAEQLSTEELPALVESLRSAGRAEAPVLTPIEAKGRDEVAQLAHAISEIQQVTMDVAEEQSDLLRRGISDIFVNLARRNQSLLDRQIDFIDQLESREENPDQLENLFRLDHLATRMRRNAESLLVLAGAEPTRRRGRPVEVVDVLRVAMGEIEDFGRIQLMSVDPSTVAGSVAVDLAHLMSELMENATQFSPPDVDVEVIGYRIADGSYQLTLADKGIGMSAEQIAAANKTLAEPPLVGLDLSRSLGFTVVSRLSHRLGVGVQLTAGAEGGVTAVITIPAEMVGSTELDQTPAITETEAVEEEPVDETPAPPMLDPLAPADLSENPFGDSTPQYVEPTPEPEPSPEPTIEPSPEPTSEPAPVAEAPTPPLGADELGKLPMRRPTTPEPTSASAEPIAGVEPEPEAPAAALPTRVPASAPEPAPEPAADQGADLFAAFGSPSSPPADTDADLFAPIDGGAPAEPVAPTPPAADPAPTQQLPVTPAPDAPAPLPTRDPAAVGAVPQAVTSAGLIRRTPKQIDVPEESRYAPGATPTPTGPAAPEAVAPTANRSPEEVRQMLSRYRAGLRKGRGPESDPDQSNRRS